MKEKSETRFVGNRLSKKKAGVIPAFNQNFTATALQH